MVLLLRHGFMDAFNPKILNSTWRNLDVSQKNPEFKAGVFYGRFFVNSEAKKLKKFLLNTALRRQGQTIVLFFLGFYYSKYEKN